MRHEARQHGEGSRAHTWVRQNILGLVAIFIALNGSAIAANMAGDHTVKVVAAKKKKKAKPGPPGPAGPQGIQGPQGTPGTARYYARIDYGTGTVQAGNIPTSAVTKPQSALMCIDGLDPAPTVGVASGGRASFFGDYASITVPGTSSCNGKQVAISVVDASGCTITTGVGNVFLQ